jgi:hypothetical protein
MGDLTRSETPPAMPSTPNPSPRSPFRGGQRLPSNMDGSTVTRRKAVDTWAFLAAALALGAVGLTAAGLNQLAAALGTSSQPDPGNPSRLALGTLPDEQVPGPASRPGGSRKVLRDLLVGVISALIGAVIFAILQHVHVEGLTRWRR